MTIPKAKWKPMSPAEKEQHERVMLVPPLNTPAFQQFYRDLLRKREIRMSNESEGGTNNETTYL